MKRYRALTVCGSLWLGTLGGCANIAETRTVEAFIEGLQAHDMAKVRDATSADFESKALSHGEPWNGLEQLQIPAGKVEVLKVEDYQDDQKNDFKKVTVQVGKSKHKVVCRFKKETPSGKWVIDDVFLNHRHLEEDKSVATQLHVQVSAVELLDIWREGNRGRILASVTPDFKQTLSELPPERLPMIANLLISDIPRKGASAKSVEIIEDKATAVFSKNKGDLVLQMRRQNGQWVVEDIHVEAREGESISSVQHLAAAMTSAISFYKAYQSSDKTTLKHLCVPEFFDGTLKMANLNQLSLPLPVTNSQDFETRLEGPAAEVTVNCNEHTVKMTLAGSGDHSPRVASRYRVREVTVYDLKTHQNMRLSTVFNGRALMQIYSEALRKRNLSELRSLSTADFNRRVWSKVGVESILLLSMDEIEDAEPQLESAVYGGAVTHLSVMQGDTPLCYVLRDVGGKTLIDDVEVPGADRNMTLKSRLELMLPIVEFSEGFRKSSLDLLRNSASRSFSRSVWNQVRRVPKLEMAPEQFLSCPLTRVVQNSDGAMVILGDESYGANVFLKRDGDLFVIEDVLMISGKEPKQRTRLLQSLKTHLARGDNLQSEEDESPRADSTPPRTLPANATLDSSIEAADVQTR